METLQKRGFASHAKDILASDFCQVSSFIVDAASVQHGCSLCGGD